MNIPSDYCSAFNSDSSEKIDYNNPLFPAYGRYRFLSRYPDYSIVSHWHEDMEFILVKKGKMTYNVNGNLIALFENNGIMVNSRQIHHGFSKECQECEFISVLLSPTLLEGNRWFYQNYVASITNNFSCPYLLLSHDDWTAGILERVELLYHIFHEKTGNSSIDTLPYFEIIEGFCSIMNQLFQNMPAPQQREKKESSEITSLRDMITYVEEHFTQHITLDDLAFAGACCKSRCFLLFQKYLHDTPVSYITKFRLKKSLVSLLETDLSITDIAFECGFGGASYYCETFRKYYGISPLKYKKEKTVNESAIG